MEVIERGSSSGALDCLRSVCMVLLCKAKLVKSEVVELSKIINLVGFVV